jgi:transcriptional regulator with XRE-family HTH domain
MIALQVRDRMSQIGMTQVVLAEKLGCTQQHISMLLKGKNNLTLETIAKLEEALDFDIIGKALIPVDGYAQDVTQSHRTYLSEPEQTPYGSKK